MATVVLILVILGIGVPASAQTSKAAGEEGAALFARACKTCHGDAGVGGAGPALRGDKFTARHVGQVAAEGRPGTMMPAFKARLTPAQIDQVAAYVASLQTRRAPAGPALPTPRGPEPAGLRGDPAAGERLFYDGARSQCGACHSIGGRGGRVGPDLQDRVGRMSARDLFRRIIVVPHQATSAAYKLRQVRTRGGQLWTGVSARETESAVHFYHTMTLPPVPLVIPKSEIVESKPWTGSVMPADYGSRLTVQQLLDLVAFLKTSTGSTKPVTLTEVVN